MSSKKTKTKTNPAESSVDSTHHRPIAFVWAVAVAGTLSTWFWYRPLPKNAVEIANRSPWHQASEIETAAPPKWHDTGLVNPFVAGAEPKTYGASLNKTSGTESEPTSVPETALTGSGDLALTPFQDTIRPLKDWVAKEPLPMVPVESTAHSARGPLPKPTLWTNATHPSESKRLDLGPPPTDLPTATLNLASEAASPFRVPTVNRPSKSADVPSMITNIWPDQGFDPSQPRPAPAASNRMATNPTSGRDAVMAVSSNRIQTLDRESEQPRTPPATPSVTQLQPVVPSAPKGESNAPRQPPSVIRQPRPRDGNR